MVQNKNARCYNVAEYYANGKAAASLVAAAIEVDNESRRQKRRVIDWMNCVNSRHAPDEETTEKQGVTAQEQKDMDDDTAAACRNMLTQALANCEK